MKLATLIPMLGALVLGTACAPGVDSGGGDGSAFGSGGPSGASTSGSGSGSSSSGDDSMPFGDPGTSTGTGMGAPEPACTGLLQGTLRDFSPGTHPDFEYTIDDDHGMVEGTLGGDGKPVYAGNPMTVTTHGKATFDEWYRDTPGVNITIPTTIQLVKGGGDVYTYDNQAYFPIDGQGYGDEGNPHNYHFTLELHTQFEYRGGEIFTFTGDDDLFTFINGRLAIDLGGVHGAESSSVNLDEQAAALGLQVGDTYSLDLFFAERHLVDSHFRIDTTIGCFSQPPAPK